jgi:hypothetical protein
LRAQSAQINVAKNATRTTYSIVRQSASQHQRRRAPDYQFRGGRAADARFATQVTHHSACTLLITQQQARLRVPVVESEARESNKAPLYDLTRRLVDVVVGGVGVATALARRRCLRCGIRAT